ncbi:MAG: aldo/keto reductase [Clostridiales bacterium]|nr:aldo/keto reductase [Clostridiales bacterium]
MMEGGNADRLLDMVYEQGINCFDTAENYGRSEISLASWIKRRHLEDKVTVITKGCHPYGHSRVTPQDLRSDFTQSVERFGHIDVYLLHRDDETQSVGPIMEELHRCVSAGLTDAIGVSNWSVERIREANAYAAQHQLTPFTVNSPNIALAHQTTDIWGYGCKCLSGKEHEEERKECGRMGVSIFAYSALARGFFSGRTKEQLSGSLDPATAAAFCTPENFMRLERCEQLAKEKGRSVIQIALAFVLNDPERIFPIVKASSETHMRELTEAMDIILTGNEMKWLDLQTDVL